MNSFTLGDLVILELALASFSKDFDISLFASLQMQDIAGKIEADIKKLSQASAPLSFEPTPEEIGTHPKA